MTRIPPYGGTTSAQPEEQLASETAAQPSDVRAVSQPAAPERNRFAVLDGWRGVSILLVLAAHMLPLGPKPLKLNTTAGSLGMSLFFAMSGFLITVTLTKPGGVRAFFTRRLFRILPLAWLYLAIVLTALGASAHQWRSHLLFLVNYQDTAFTQPTLHFWSLCVEIHFYLAIGLLFALLGRRGLLLLPFGMLAITAGKLLLQPDVQMASHLRWDEILAGVMLALIYLGDLPGSAGVRRALSRVPVVLPAAVLVLTCLPQLSMIQPLRPYAALVLVGATLFGRRSGVVHQALTLRILAYVASISYALYVIHPALIYGWLAAADSQITLYLVKRPISLVLIFVLAHLSTRHFEARFIGFGKRINARRERRATVDLPAAVAPATS